MAITTIQQTKHPEISVKVTEVSQEVRAETLKECAEKVTLTQDENMINSLDKNSLDL